MDLPPTIAPGELTEIGNYFLLFEKLNKAKAIKELDIRRRIHNAHDTGILVDYASSNAKEQSEELLEKVITGEESIYNVEVYFLAQAEDLKQLNYVSKSIINKLFSRSAKAFLEDIALPTTFNEIFLSTKIGRLKRGQLVHSKYMANILPLYNEHLFNTGISFETIKGKEVFVNLFDDSSNNFNVLISGLSGSGKSAIAQKIIYEEYMNGASIVVLDRGGSFQKLCEYFDGVSITSEFDPLQFKSPSFIKELILSLIPPGSLGPKEEASLYRAIVEELNCTNNFKELLVAIDKRGFEVEVFFDEIINTFSSKNESKLDRFTYLDTEKFPEKVLPGLILFLVESFKNIQGRKIFVFDECWHLLDRNVSYLAESYRTFRKIGASAISITQGLSDFSQSKLGQVVINSSDYKFLFRQELDQEYALDDFDKENIKTLKTVKGEYSEFYFKHPLHRKILRYFQTPLEYELFTTHHEDRKYFQKFYNDFSSYMNFKDLLKRFVEIKYGQDRSATTLH